MSAPLKFAVLTSSDTGHIGGRSDIGGDAVVETMQAQGHQLTRRALLPDDRIALASQLSLWSSDEDVQVILTTGGTGLGPRDVMPEAMGDVLEYEVPGIAEAMRAASLAVTPMAMLSRAKAGVCNRTLIINLPGSPKGAVETLQVALPVIAHAVEIVGGDHHGRHPVPE